MHGVAVDGFFAFRAPVTNNQFRKFVNTTGYVTFAEIKPDANNYSGALPHMLKAGSLVFTPPRHAVDLRDWGQWWAFKFGANWRWSGAAISGIEWLHAMGCRPPNIGRIARYSASEKRARIARCG